MNALNFHKKLKGKIEIRPKIKVSRKNFPLFYTPGVAEVAREISKDSEKSFLYTSRANNVAIITDGSRTLGVGDASPESSLPVMEGKAVLFKAMAGIDAYPLCLASKEKKDIIKAVELLRPNFAGFNLEDIESPKCFEIMKELEKKKIPVFHDDRQGAAIATFAGLINALKVMGKKMKNIKICLAGAGAAGYGIFEIFRFLRIKNLVVFDAKGIIYRGRKGDNIYLKDVADYSNPENIKDGLKTAIRNTDVFIGFSGVGNLLDKADIASMADRPIVFALSNPRPEILPSEIEKTADDYLYATGRPDFPNQINNALVFPGIFRGMLDNKKAVSAGMSVKIAEKLASLVSKPAKKRILPSVFDKRLVKTIKNCF